MGVGVVVVMEEGVGLVLLVGPTLREVEAGAGIIVGVGTGSPVRSVVGCCRAVTWLLLSGTREKGGENQVVGRGGWHICFAWEPGDSVRHTFHAHGKHPIGVER